MNETKAIRIASVKYVGDHKLRLRWVSGAVTQVDLREPVYRLSGLRWLRNKSKFAQAEPGEGGHSVAWPGDLDLGADGLWEMALEQSGRHDAVQFIRWRSQHGFSLTQAAEALGLSRRQVAYYAQWWARRSPHCVVGLQGLGSRACIDQMRSVATGSQEDFL